MSEIKDILRQEGFTFSKQFGQNFLFDTNLLRAIVTDAKVCPTDTCVEVGAGAGALTLCLSDVAKKVIAYEIDRRLIRVLTQIVRRDNVEFVYQDILKQDLCQLEEKIGGEYKIVANLPYYISTPFIASICEQTTNCTSLTVMVQQEVADRLCAREGGKEYGSLTVAVNCVASARITRKVSRNMFTPPPNVDSAVVNIEFCRSQYDIASRKALREVTRSAFAMRRKTLLNNLCKSFSLDKEQVADLLTRCDIDSTARGETLSVAKFVELANLLNGVLHF